MALTLESKNGNRSEWMDFEVLFTLLTTPPVHSRYLTSYTRCNGNWKPYCKGCHSTVNLRCYKKQMSFCNEMNIG